MHIVHSGTTRLVFVARNIVIKVPKLFLRNVARKAIQVAHRGEVRIHIKTAYGSIWKVLAHVFRNVSENQKEWKFSKVCVSQNIAPTLFSFLGLVNGQVRCDSVDANHPLWVNFVQGLSKQQIDLYDIRPKNYGLYKGKLVCIDYSKDETQSFLMGVGGQILSLLSSSEEPVYFKEGVLQ